MINIRSLGGCFVSLCFVLQFADDLITNNESHQLYPMNTNNGCNARKNQPSWGICFDREGDTEVDKSLGDRSLVDI